MPTPLSCKNDNQFTHYGHGFRPQAETHGVWEGECCEGIWWSKTVHDMHDTWLLDTDKSGTCLSIDTLSLPNNRRQAYSSCYSLYWGTFFFSFFLRTVAEWVGDTDSDSNILITLTDCSQKNHICEYSTVINNLQTVHSLPILTFVYKQGSKIFYLNSAHHGAISNSPDAKTGVWDYVSFLGCAEKHGPRSICLVSTMFKKVRKKVQQPIQTDVSGQYQTFCGNVHI